MHRYNYRERIAKTPSSKLIIPVSSQKISEADMEGLWTIEYASNIGNFGSGVAVFTKEGKILGGDSSYYYIGTYKLESSTSFQAELNIQPFIPGAPSVFNTSEVSFNLTIAGQLIHSTHCVAQGHPLNQPELHIGLKLTKRS